MSFAVGVATDSLLLLCCMVGIAKVGPSPKRDLLAEGASAISRPTTASGSKTSGSLEN